MSDYTKVYNTATGDTILASDFNTEFSAIEAAVNSKMDAVDFASGTVSFSTVAASGAANASVAHGLGTDDIDFGCTVRGTDAIGLGGLLVNACLVGADSRHLYMVHPNAGTIPTPTGASSSGNIDIYVTNTDVDSQDIIVHWWARKR
jgi:hypothetical protein